MLSVRMLVEIMEQGGVLGRRSKTWRLLGTETAEDVVMRRRSKTWRLLGTEMSEDVVMRRCKKWRLAQAVLVQAGV